MLDNARPQAPARIPLCAVRDGRPGVNAAELATEMAVRRAAWQDGFDVGFDAGRAAEAFARDQAWREMAEPVARCGRLLARRWELRGEPRTRATFSQPHPGDYLGASRARAHGGDSPDLAQPYISAGGE
jgi:hypothetical protein